MSGPQNGSEQGKGQVWGQGLSVVVHAPLNVGSNLISLEFSAERVFRCVVHSIMYLIPHHSLRLESFQSYSRYYVTLVEDLGATLRPLPHFPSSLMPVSHYTGSSEDHLRFHLDCALTPGGSSGDPQGILSSVTPA